MPALRPFLLDGALAEAGVLDRAKLDEALTVEQLIWGASPNQIMWAAATEAWVRHWQGRAGDSLSAPRKS
jgi:asparagine synthase (glutamine-hydrolysing)